MDELKIITLKESVFEDNNADAELLRRELTSKNTFFINLMASPGAGKTSVLRALIPLLREKLSIAVMEADIDSSVDAQAIAETGIKSIQLHTVFVTACINILLNLFILQNLNTILLL